MKFVNSSYLCGFISCSDKCISKDWRRNSVGGRRAEEGQDFPPHALVLGGRKRVTESLIDKENFPDSLSEGSQSKVYGRTSKSQKMGKNSGGGTELCWRSQSGSSYFIFCFLPSLSPISPISTTYSSSLQFWISLYILKLKESFCKPVWSLIYLKYQPCLGTHFNFHFVSVETRRDAVCCFRKLF